MLFWPTQVFAWGGDGHRIVCAIAWDEVRPVTRQRVETLLSINDRDGFADLCLWADEYREQGHRETAPWHFINVPIGATHVGVARDCPEPRTCAIVQVERDVDVLRSKAPHLQKAEALKFLIHFVGDLHQPLHVGHREDGGGDSIKVQFLGHQTNMHSVWDSGIIMQSHRTWRKIADMLEHGITEQQRAHWSKSDPLAWANESLSISNSPETRYHGSADELHLGRAYERKELPVVHDRLSQAGVRLGYLLNTILIDH